MQKVAALLVRPLASASEQGLPRNRDNAANATLRSHPAFMSAVDRCIVARQACAEEPKAGEQSGLHQTRCHKQVVVRRSMKSAASCLPSCLLNDDVHDRHDL